MTLILNGTATAARIQSKLQERIKKIKGRKPGFAVILVGADPASVTYVKAKRKACESVGISSLEKRFPATITENELLQEIVKFNEDPMIDGILIQLPLPPHIQTLRIMEAINPSKDIDGFHPLNVGKLLVGDESGFLPCTPQGICALLHDYKISLEGKHVVIVGRSNIVGKPLAAMLLQKKKGYNATVTVANSKTQNLQELCLSADILIAAAGNVHLIKANMIKTGAVVVDVGIHRIEDSSVPRGYRLTGDVAFEEASLKCAAITPAPGGIGPMTIVMALSNTLLSYERQQKT